MRPNPCTMYSVISERGVYYSDEFGGAAYPQCLEMFEEEAQKYADRCKKKWPNYNFNVIEVEITPNPTNT